MSDTAGIESGILTSDLRGALRTLLSRKSETYLEFPSTADAPGVCICTSYADLRRLVEAEYQTKLKSSPKVPLNYCAGGGRRKLPDGLPRQSTHQYKDVGTQTEASPEGVAYAGQVESAPEAPAYRKRRLRRVPVSRAICSSSSGTESAGGRPAQRISSQSSSFVSRYLFSALIVTSSYSSIPSSV
jgi:hypothetical protein